MLLLWWTARRTDTARKRRLTSTSTITVRIADYSKASDAKSVSELLNEYAMDPMGDGERLPEDLLNALPKELSGVPHAFSVLAFDGAQAVGLCNCFGGFSTFKCKPLVNIHDCFVKSQFRGRGVVDAMFREVERVARERGACKITLEVLSKNLRAQKAYARSGFGAYELDPAAGHALFWQKKLSCKPDDRPVRRTAKSPARR